jgi:NADH:ubiquinone oxidoreductase
MKILSTHDLQAIMQRAENALRLREQSNKKIAEKSCGLTIGTDHL